LNFHILAKLLGLLQLTFGASMLPSLCWSVYYRDGAFAPLASAMAITLAFGAALYFWGRRKDEDIFRKEATATVGLGWLLSAFFGALPYYFAQLSEMPTFADCYFESMSGLTTTGASVLADIEAIPKGLLFWRSWTHWLGGLGIIMLFVAILPYLGAGGRALVRNEVTGPVKEGLTPRIKDTALLLYRLYIGYTVVETILLMMAGMNFFDALCHTFGTLATGGFSTQNTSVAAYYDNGAIEIIILIFMILAGTNFALMYAAISGRPLKLWKDAEWRFYISIIGGAALVIAILLLSSNTYQAIDHALRDSLFAVVSLLTTTGFVTADFEAWPVSTQVILAVLMFFGGCAGSTGGGLKIMRWAILFKVAQGALDQVYRPRTIRKPKIGGVLISDELQVSTLSVFLLWVLTFLLGAFAIALIEQGRIDLITPFSVSASTLNNIGPGFSMVGATQNYGFFLPSSKWVLSLLMVLGRLELYSILVLFVPRFWRVS